MRMPNYGLSALLIATLFAFALGCSGSNSTVPTLPGDGAVPQQNTQNNPSPDNSNMNRESWGSYYMVVNEDTLTIDIIPNRTADAHYNVTWVKTICPQCVTAQVKNVDLNTRTFYIELHTKNPTLKIGHDVRFIIDLDGTEEYDLLDPDDYTKFWSMTGDPNPFRALAKDVTGRLFLPGANHVDYMNLYISASHSPITYIPFKIDVSYPGACAEPYTITDVNLVGDLPPGGGGSATVTCVVWDWQDNWGEVWLRTGGMFTASDILMTAGTNVGVHGKNFSATFSNDIGGAAGQVKILIEAYNNDTIVEPMPMNEYARVWVDPGGASAIAGDVFNAVTKLAINGSQVLIHNTGAGADPPPFNISDGTYYVPVQAGNYNVKALQNLYFAQDTLNDVVVPPDTVVLVCFGLAPQWLDDPTEALATISGVILDSQTGDAIVGAQARLDGGAQTGGVIQTRITDSRGHYCFYAVPTYQQNNWTVHAFHPAYLPDDFTNVGSAANKSTAQIDFHLQSLTADAVWRENFEAGPSNVGTQHDWTFKRVSSQTWPGDGTSSYHNGQVSGDLLWHIQDPNSDPSQDIFYTNGICTLPPDDTSNGFIPSAFEGHQYMWYGEAHDTTGGPAHGGSFIDEWTGDSFAGGYSANGPNAGTAQTGPINLTGQTDLTLTLQSYWEIEAVDPSIQYDAMDVLISTNGTNWYRLDRLNPLAEPVPDSGNADKAYTSAGYNQSAVWQPSVFDISSYAGNATVYLRFDFDTIDALYNGFRGWVVDDITIWPYAVN